MAAKRERNPAEKRERLLVAALEVFQRDGFYEAKLDDIADKAGVGKGTIYEFFRSKEDLFEQTVLAGISLYISRIEAEAARPGPLWDRIRNLGLYHVGVFLKSRALLRLPLDGYGILSETLKLRILAIRERLVESMTRLLAEGRRRGEFPADIDPRLAAVVLIGALNGLGADLLLQSAGEQTSAARSQTGLDEAVESVLSLLRRGWG